MRPTHRQGRTTIRWGLLFVLVVVIAALGWWTNSRERNISSNNTAFPSNTANATRVTVGENVNAAFSLLPDETVQPEPPKKTTADFPKSASDCTQADGSWEWRDSLCWPNDEATCTSFDGLWGAYGLHNATSCYIRTADAGSVCSDNDECLGYCIVSPGQIQDQDRDDEVSNVKGTCTPRLPVRDCVTALTDGRPAVVCPQ